MRPNIGTLLGALLALVALPSCATIIVTADPYERNEVEGDQRLQLYMDRVRIKGMESARPQVCFECNTVGNASNPTAFKLPFVATNETDEPWKLRGDMFAMTRLVDGLVLPKTEAIQHTDIIANIAPHSSARFSTLIAFVGSSGGIEKNSDLYGRYRLTVTGDDGTVFLERTLSVGYFSQARQLGRFMGFFAVGLLALGAL